jgi:CxxC-x17-CxxC domain-containing protein
MKFIQTQLNGLKEKVTGNPTSFLNSLNNNNQLIFFVLLSTKHRIERGETMSRERRNFGGPREMYKAVCSDCGKECEVPFKPTEGRPVYCQDCFAKHRPPRRY